MADDLVLQFRYGLGESSFLLPEESSERFGYWTHQVMGGVVYPYDQPNIFYVRGGGHFAHADESSLGSRRVLAGVEGGWRFYVPWKFLHYVRFETGIGGGIGWSALNFGGGDIPQSGVDGQVGLHARLLFHYKGFDLGVGAMMGLSPAREYTERGAAAFITIPIGSVAATVENDCDKVVKKQQELLALERDVGEKMGHTKLMGTKRDLEFEKNEDLRKILEERKKKWAKLGATCLDIPANAKKNRANLPKVPERPTVGNCSDLLADLEAYQSDLNALKEKLEGSRSPHRIAFLDSVEISTVHDEMETWADRCQFQPASRYEFVEKGQIYRLTATILFTNDDPDLPLTPQNALVNGLSTYSGYANAALDEWIRFLEQHDNYRIRIDGYASDTTSGGTQTDAQMQELAQQRANGVALYLQKRGSPGASYVYDSRFYPKEGRPGSVPIDGPFVPRPSKAVSSKQILTPTGHGPDGLNRLLQEEYGVDPKSGIALKMKTDPAFRSVRITLFKEEKGQLVPIDLKGDILP